MFYIDKGKQYDFDKSKARMHRGRYDRNDDPFFEAVSISTDILLRHCKYFASRKCGIHSLCTNDGDYGAKLKGGVANYQTVSQVFRIYMSILLRCLQYS